MSIRVLSGKTWSKSEKDANNQTWPKSEKEMNNQSRQLIAYAKLCILRNLITVFGIHYRIYSAIRRGFPFLE